MYEELYQYVCIPGHEVHQKMHVLLTASSYVVFGVADHAKPHSAQCRLRILIGIHLISDSGYSAANNKRVPHGSGHISVPGVSVTAEWKKFGLLMLVLQIDL